MKLEEIVRFGKPFSLTEKGESPQLNIDISILNKMSREELIANIMFHYHSQRRQILTTLDHGAVNDSMYVPFSDIPALSVAQSGFKMEFKDFQNLPSKDNGKTTSLYSFLRLATLKSVNTLFNSKYNVSRFLSVSPEIIEGCLELNILKGTYYGRVNDNSIKTVFETIYPIEGSKQHQLLVKSLGENNQDLLKNIEVPIALNSADNLIKNNKPTLTYRKEPEFHTNSVLMTENKELKKGRYIPYEKRNFPNNADIVKDDIIQPFDSTHIRGYDLKINGTDYTFLNPNDVKRSKISKHYIPEDIIHAEIAFSGSKYSRKDAITLSLYSGMFPAKISGKYHFDPGFMGMLKEYKKDINTFKKISELARPFIDNHGAYVSKDVVNDHLKNQLPENFYEGIHSILVDKEVLFNSFQIMHKYLPQQLFKEDVKEGSINLLDLPTSKPQLLLPHYQGASQ